MKLRRWNGIGWLPALLLAAIWCAGCAQGPTVQGLGEGSIAVEDRTPQFKATVDRHLKNATSPFVYISWFPSPGSEEFAQINAAGGGVKGWVTAGGVPGPLLMVKIVGPTLNQVQELLKELPPSDQNVAQHSAVIVTFYNEGGFHTRIYDRFAIPSRVHRIWHLLTFPGMAMDCGPTTKS
jgi:hypothetical protein